jgi:urease accessory protein
VGERSALQVGLSGGRSVVLRARAHTPLTLLNPDNHGHAAWVYQSSHGGGLVGADEVCLGVRVDDGATLFLSTQASGKVYRGARAATALEATVGEGALFVNWPDPVVCFAGAALAQRVSVRAAAGAGVLLVDSLTSGRVARGERWRFSSFSSRLDLDVGGAPALREALHLDPAHGPLEERLAAWDALATVVLAGPGLAAVADEVEAAVLALAPGLAAASRTPFGLVARVAARDAAALGSLLRGLLAPRLRALLGDDPLTRKW